MPRANSEAMWHTGRIHPRLLHHPASSTSGSCLKVTEGLIAIKQHDLLKKASLAHDCDATNHRRRNAEYSGVAARNHHAIFRPSARTSAQRDQLGCACWLRLLNCAAFQHGHGRSSLTGPSFPILSQRCPIQNSPTTGSWPAASSSPFTLKSVKPCSPCLSLPGRLACFLACLVCCIASELLFNSPPTQAPSHPTPFLSSSSAILFPHGSFPPST
jgi:hypothetical protein